VFDGPGVVFNKVWLTHQPPKMGLKPKRHVGTLTINGAGATFVAKDHQVSIPSGQWLVVQSGQAGSDIVNSWVHIRFTDARGVSGDAFLNDGRFLGWAGIFGGAKRIQHALQGAHQ
jgi:hypothetical protein